MFFEEDCHVVELSHRLFLVLESWSMVWSVGVDGRWSFIIFFCGP